MPNELLIPKGPYEVGKRNRRLDGQNLWINYKQRSRLHAGHVEYSHKRCMILIGYYCGFYTFLAIGAIFFFDLLFLSRGSSKPYLNKIPSLTCAPGINLGHMVKIQYKETIVQDIDPLVEQLDNYIVKYGLEGQRHLRECNLDSFWGYRTSSPCVLLKLNNAVGFQVLTYNDAKTLPEESPDELYDTLLEMSAEHRWNRVWVTCEANLNIKITYVPTRFFEADGLFLEEHIYVQPLFGNISEKEVFENPAYRRVMGVKFSEIPRNRDVFLTCIVWAKNIPLDKATVRIWLHVKSNEALLKAAEPLYPT